MARSGGRRVAPSEGLLAAVILLVCLAIGWGVLAQRSAGVVRWDVVVVPVGIPNDEVMPDLVSQLEREHIVRVLPAIPAPEAAWDGLRFQYDAERFLQGLESVPLQPHEKLLAVAEENAGTTELTIVFGLAEQSGQRAVVFTKRLLDGATPAQARHRVLTTARHELGHLAGLTHCFTSTCAMHFSIAVADTDAKGPAFCPYCEQAWSAAHG